jgi:hypothetical protein
VELEAASTDPSDVSRACLLVGRCWKDVGPCYRAHVGDRPVSLFPQRGRRIERLRLPFAAAPVERQIGTVRQRPAALRKTRRKRAGSELSTSSLLARTRCCSPWAPMGPSAETVLGHAVAATAAAAAEVARAAATWRTARNRLRFDAVPRGLRGTARWSCVATVRNGRVSEGQRRTRHTCPPIDPYQRRHCSTFSHRSTKKVASCSPDVPIVASDALSSTTYCPIRSGPRRS